MIKAVEIERVEEKKEFWADPEGWGDGKRKSGVGSKMCKIYCKIKGIKAKIAFIL